MLTGSILERIGSLLKKGALVSAKGGCQEDVNCIARSSMFDRDYYLNKNPDVAASGMDPIEHYVQYGAAEGRDPSAWFSTTFYLTSNADVKAAQVNPLRHFIEFGESEGRAALPQVLGEGKKSTSTGGHKASEPRRGAHAIIRASELFDESYYLACYPEVARARLDPLDHYISLGASEGKNPHPLFDTNYYKTRNRDVAASGMNPFAHYCRYGWRELRDPSECFDAVWFWVMNQNGSDELRVPPIGTSEASSIRRVGRLAGKEAADFRRACHEIIIGKKVDPRRLKALVKYAVSNSLWDVVEEALSALIAHEPEDLSHRLKLAEAVERQGRIWQCVEVLKNSVIVAPDNGHVWAKLGDALERMERYQEAASAFSQAVSSSGDSADWLYRAGYCLEKAGARGLALQKYSAAIAKDKTRNASRFGIGVFHQSRGLWYEAALAYGEHAIRSPLDADLNYMLGMALDRCYRWVEAEAAYRRSLALDFRHPYRHYRLGLVLERQENYGGAGAAYRAAADLDSTHRPYWRYRSGYCFERAADYHEACQQYLSMDRDWLEHANLDPVDRVGNSEYWQDLNDAGELEAHWASMDRVLALEPDCLFRLGRYREQQQRWRAAAEAYKMALARSLSHEPSWHWRLGYVLTRLGEMKDACESFRHSRILKRPFGVNISKYEEDAGTRDLMEYAEYYETYPIQQRTILYESFMGAAVACNPYAIFRYLVDNPEFSDWQHVWVLNNPSDAPTEYAGRVNVIFVPRGCDAYRRYLAVSEYLINNVTFPYWFIRRQGQKYLNTWHGTPIKALGRDMKCEFMAHGNVTRNLLHATHVISANRHTSDVLMRRYDVDGLFSGMLAETGYPRTDLVVTAGASKRCAVLEALGLDGGKPVVLYAPTWRGTQGRPETDKQWLLSTLAALQSSDYQLVFRGHHFMESALQDADITVAVARQSIDTADLLSVVDVLVTDYSSIVFDFLPTGRPIIYYAYDLEEYVESRGLYLDLTELPGEICRDADSVRSVIFTKLGATLRDDPRYERAISRYCPYEDGSSTKRVVDFLFAGSETSVVSRYDDLREAVVMYNGLFPPNGITSSFLNLVEGLSEKELHIATLFEPDKIKMDPVRIQKFESMPDHVKCLAREGRMVLGPEEIWVLARFKARRNLDSSEMWEILWSSFQREYRRLFGSMRHAAFVHFEGYNSLTALIAASASGVQKSIYLHNDMVEERNLKLPYLNMIFRTYNRYDNLVSVSPAMNAVNKRKLCKQFDIGAEKFVSCRNTIHVEQILSLCRSPLDSDLASWFGGGSTFLAMGRLSPEKDHSKLLRSFATLLKDRPEAKLVILGDGPLKRHIAGLIDDLNLADSVKLAGLRMNPYPALRACDCFILPSNHEGQPMVLLEAMTLGKPIIATDIDGNRGVLSESYGRLVENSEAGLTQGMLDFMNMRDESMSFDPYSYQQIALDEFKRIVLPAKDSR
jgi:CDP-glycerol glycerophosphotransferase